MEDNDDVVTAFVEICSRLDRLIVAQELTNSVLLRLASTQVVHLEDPATDASHGAVYPVSGLPRGLGSLIPRS
jgi:non-ribosomal peptide synthetase component E (peptide arylation enzyme)